MLHSRPRCTCCCAVRWRFGRIMVVLLVVFFVRFWSFLALPGLCCFLRVTRDAPLQIDGFTVSCHTCYRIMRTSAGTESNCGRGLCCRGSALRERVYTRTSSFDVILPLRCACTVTGASRDSAHPAGPLQAYRAVPMTLSMHLDNPCHNVATLFK